MKEAIIKRKGLWTALLVIISKSSKFAKIFKVLKLFKFGKILVTFVSMAISAFVYAFLLGPWFAVGFVLMLFIHEMGHVMAMKMKGMPTSAPVFIPMLGAVIFAPRFKNREDEAYVGIAGPLVGGVAAVALFGVWFLLPQRSEIVLLLSHTAIFLNLFNLVPISPLDGGRTTQIVGEWFKYLGLLGLLLFTLYIRQPSILLIWILILQDTKLRPWLKLSIGATCEISMVALMIAGFSGQKWWMDLIDAVIATGFNSIFFLAVLKAKLESKETNLVSGEAGKEEVLPSAPMKARLKWLAFYFALVVALVLFMVAQTPYLPHQIKH